MQWQMKRILLTPSYAYFSWRSVVSVSSLAIPVFGTLMEPFGYMVVPVDALNCHINGSEAGVKESRGLSSSTGVEERKLFNTRLGHELI